MHSRRIQKVSTYGAGAVAVVTTSALMDYPWLFLAQGLIFCWMFGWGFYWGQVDTRAKLEAEHAKKY